MRIIKNNSKKSYGYGLIEVIISMAIIGIIAVGVYAGYIFAMKNTKHGQVKQGAALEGKKVVEEIKSENIQLPVSANGVMQIGDMSLKKQGTSNIYSRFLDENYNEIVETSAKFVELVTIQQTKAHTETNEEKNVSFSDNLTTEVNSEDINYKLNISKEQLQIGNTIKDFIYHEESTKKELQGQNKIILTLYLDIGTTSNKRTIKIMDYRGKEILNSGDLYSISGKINININFDKYKPIESSVQKPVVINVYNLTTDIPNIYVEKSNSQDLNVDMKIFKGQMNLYNNRAEDPQEAKIGSLYDIKVEVMEYQQYKDDQKNNTHEEKNNLFTAHYKQSIK